MLADKKFKAIKAKAGFHPSLFTPEPKTQKTCPVIFTLVAANFGVKYINKADIIHLEYTSKAHYPMKPDLIGNQYIGTDLRWNYNDCTLKQFITNFVQQS